MDITKDIFEKIEFPIVEIILILIATYILVRIFSFFYLKIAECFVQYRFKLMRILPIIKLFIWIVAIYVVLVPVMNIRGETLLAVSGAIGLAVGFALRDVASNMIAGISLAFDKPFHVGDKLKIKEHYGEVIDIGLRSTLIRTPGDSIVSVPNLVFLDTPSSSGNYGELHMMVLINFYLDHAVNLEVVKRAIWEGVITSGYMYIKKPVAIVIEELEYSTKVTAKAYVFDERYEFDFLTDVTERVKNEFARLGVEYTRLRAIPLGKG